MHLYYKKCWWDRRRRGGKATSVAEGHGSQGDGRLIGFIYVTPTSEGIPFAPWGMPSTQIMRHLASKMGLGTPFCFKDCRHCALVCQTNPRALTPYQKWLRAIRPWNFKYEIKSQDLRVCREKLGNEAEGPRKRGEAANGDEKDERKLLKRKEGSWGGHRAFCFPEGGRKSGTNKEGRLD